MKNVIKYTKQYRFILNGTLNSYMRTTYDLRFKSNEVYLRKCKQVNILPLLYRFMFNDTNLFHKVVYKIIPVTMPFFNFNYKKYLKFEYSSRYDAVDISCGPNSILCQWD